MPWERELFSIKGGGGLDCRLFYLVHVDPHKGYYIAKEFQQCLIELRFLEVYVNLMFAKFVEHKANLFAVSFLSLKDQDFIKYITSN